MNRIPFHRRRSLRRIAVSTAVAVGAALLTFPATATAQGTGIDCTALGNEPTAPSTGAALEIAMACGVEVGIDKASTVYDTFSVTPQGQLHQVSTVASAQMLQDRGAADPTLVAADGTLVQADSAWAFTLSGGGDLPLIATDAASLRWGGETPEPVYSGTTAVYDGLTDGLDLALDSAVSSLGIEFTVADTEAWTALTSGLTLDAAVGTGMVAWNGLYLRHPSDYPESGSWEQTTPFALREADGTTHSVALALGEDGALSLALPDGTLDAAAFPLTVTAQWGYHNYGINEWGAVTSASPDLAVFRGEAGLGEPYFTAAGQGADAVVGAYCDALVDPACEASAEAAVYWNFWGPILGDIQPSSWRYRFSFPKTEATFQVDAAEGSDCVAPDLVGTGVYRLTSTWDNRPSVSSSRPAVSGTCQDGTAVYDLDPWIVSGEFRGGGFGMPASAETARFDGSSARFEIYMDIHGVSLTTDDCDTWASDPAYQSSTTLTYGDFSADVWYEDLLGSGMSWTATIRNLDTGATVLSTAPEPVVDGAREPSRLAGQEDGLYEIKEVFTSDGGGHTETSTCHVLIDSSAPELIEIEVDEGPYHIGDTVAIEVTVADQGFPDDLNELTVRCATPYPSCSPVTQTLTEGSTVTFEQTLYEDSTTVRIRVRDRAWNYSETEEIALDVVKPSNDFNLDGHQDLVTVRKSDGRLMFHEGKGDGTFEAAVPRSSGWGRMDVVMAGDLTADRFPDLLARDNRTGHLYTYPGDGTGGFDTRLHSGTGWNSMSMFTAATDFNEDGHTDLLAVRKADDELYLYPGGGDGTFGSRTLIDDRWLDDWGRFDNLTSVGDVNLDGVGDILARDNIISSYYVYYSDSEGGWEQRRSIDASLLTEADDGARFSQVVGGGDYNEDDWNDILAVDARTGELVLRSYDQNFFEVTADEVVGANANTSRLPVVDTDRAYDFYSDGNTDIVARRASDGVAYLYQGDGAGGFTSRGWFGDDVANMNLITTAGDFDGDGYADVIARVASTGSLYLFPGNGQGNYDYDARFRIGTGWNVMSGIVSGHDYDSDGKIDIIAHERSTGYLWLYPGTGAGDVVSRVRIGSGWDAMREITAVGDLDHDGHADLIAVRNSDDCMYFYGGRGNGAWHSAVKVGCGWDGMDSLAAVEDFNGDGHGDFVARRESDGKLFLYQGDGAGDFGSATAIGTGWDKMDIIA